MAWDWFEEMRKMQRNMDRLFSEMFSQRSTAFEGFRQPAVDMINKPKEIVVIADLPGVKKDEISLDCEPHGIKIEAKSKEKKEEKKKGYYYQERSAIGYRRVLSFPEEVIPEKAKASFKNGVLEISVPKKKVVKKKKRRVSIPVK